MPNVYREKVCPRCEKTHRKRGMYCSASCGNSGREVSDKQRENMRKVATEFNLTPEAIAMKRMIQSGVPPDEFDVAIPSLDPDLSEWNDFERGEKW